MAKSLKQLQHKLKYVTTHKKMNLNNAQIYYEDVLNTRRLGGNYFVILHLDSYREFSNEFFDFDEAKKYALVMCVYYTGYSIYDIKSSACAPVLLETQTITHTLMPSNYQFKPKKK